MSHPLLTKVLLAVVDGDEVVATIVAAIQPEIADRLERALDMCRMCGAPRATQAHYNSLPVTWFPTPFYGLSPSVNHAYVPLVTP